MKNYTTILAKLDDFIKKYYKTKILQGAILFVLFALASLLLFSGIEYFTYLSIIFRSTFFLLIIFTLLFLLLVKIIKPFLRLKKLGKSITNEEASKIISLHFEDIEDKLLNVIELAKNDNNNTQVSKELLEAAIEKKASQLKLIPFYRAISYKEIKLYSKYLIITVLISCIVLFVYPSIYKEGTFRILHPGRYFVKPAPFAFTIKNTKLKCNKGDDFKLIVELNGKYLPSDVYINYGGNSFTMQRKSKHEFVYQFRALNNTLNFYFQADKYTSANYNLEVLPTPSILKFVIEVQPPAYTKQDAVILENVGDLNVPQGTLLTWKIKAINTDEVLFHIDSLAPEKSVLKSDIFHFEKKAKTSGNYSISIKNKFQNKLQLLNYAIKVIPDLYPGIDVQFLPDSLNKNVFYYKGNIKDDYGFTYLRFNYSLHSEGKIKLSESISIPINTVINNQEFYFVFDFSTINNPENNEVKYCFEVWDNDAANGIKSTKSQFFNFKAPTLEELANEQENANNEIQKKLDNSKKLVDELQKSVEELQKDIRDPNTSQWKKVSDLNKISQKQQALEQVLEEMKQINQEKNSQVNSFSEQEQKILDKQKMLEEMLDNILSEDLKKLMDEISKLKNNVLDQEKLNEISEKIKLDYKDLEKQLDRNMELLKQYEVEERLNNTIQQLNELANEQQDLSDKLNDKKHDNNQLQEEIDKQKEKFNEIEQDYKETLEKNNELKNPENIEEYQNEFQNIKENLQNDSENMKNNNRGKAAKGAAKNAQEMKSLADKMSSKMQDNEEEMAEENIDDLKQLIKNIISYSFSQEELIKATKGIDIADPNFIKTYSKQNSLVDDFRVIEDSLNALRSRTPQIGSAIEKDLREIKRLQKALKPAFEERRIGQITNMQQQNMAAANNLALLLGEVMDQMMAAQNQSGKGSPSDKTGKGKKKGGNNPGFGDIKKLQNSLKKQLEKMLEQLKNGNLPGEQQNQQLAKMLSQQEILSKMLQDLKNKGGLQNSTMKQIDEINNLIEETQRDIINRKITPTTINRQQQIQTKLLEAENAEQEREIDKKRQSNENKNNSNSNPGDNYKNKFKNNSYIEEINYGEIKMHEFYQNNYKKYLNIINQK